jgi:AraC family transcriptional regulator of arabinose operon
MHIFVTEGYMMFLNYANSSKDMPYGYMNKNIPIEINSCGTYRLNTDNEMETCRPDGRIDYQLIYIASGKGYFYFHNSMRPTVLEAGNIVLYHPNEFQKYEYKGKDQAHIYWIHFTGSRIDELFFQYRLNPTDHIFPSGTKSFYAQSFEQIILELQMRKSFYQESAAVLFSHIIMMLGRYQQDLSNNNWIPSNDLEEITAYFHEHYRENINIENFIEARGYSVSSFFRKFKQYTGMAPLQYLLQIRLSNAMKLLETTNFPINEIAALVGYDNALYFSRLFHKHIGISPKEYRDSI